VGGEQSIPGRNQPDQLDDSLVDFCPLNNKLSKKKRHNSRNWSLHH